MTKKTHKIKLLLEFADDVLKGKKSFEIRKNDRDYKKGDDVIFQVVDYSRDNMAYIQHPLNDKKFRISYLIDGSKWGLQEGYVVFGIVPYMSDDKLDVSPEGRAFRLLLDEYYGTPQNWDDYQTLKKGIDELENYRMHMTSDITKKVESICGIPLEKAFEILNNYRNSNGLLMEQEYETLKKELAETKRNNIDLDVNCSRIVKDLYETQNELRKRNDAIISLCESLKAFCKYCEDDEPSLKKWWEQ